jgi:hypothetical protein
MLASSVTAASTCNEDDPGRDSVDRPRCPLTPVPLAPDLRRDGVRQRCSGAVSWFIVRKVPRWKTSGATDACEPSSRTCPVTMR